MQQPSDMDAKRSLSRRKKGPAADLYKSLMINKASSQNALFEHGNCGISFTLKPNHQAGLNLVVGGEVEENNSLGQNPMRHFEHNMNSTMRLRCPKIIHDKKDGDYRDDTSDNDIDELLCNELAEAFENDMFNRGMTYDNKWEDCNSLARLSNDSDLDEFASLQDKTLSDSNSQGYPEFEIDPINSTLPDSDTTETVDNAGLRFQLKHDTWKLKSEIMNNKSSFPDSKTDGLNQNSTSNLTLPKTKYWATNVDIQTKWAAEKLSRDWKTVRRFALDLYGIKGKPLSSRVKCICSEDGFQGKRLEILIQDKFSKAPPLVKRVNTTAAAAKLSDYIGSVITTRNDSQESPLQAIEDESLRNCLLAAKNNSNKIWYDCEKLEFT